MAAKIINYPAKDTCRLDLIFGVIYSDGLVKTRKILAEVADSDRRILKNPAPMIAVKELLNSNVNFMLRIRTHRHNYWNVNFDTIEMVKRRFDAMEITIPFPQRFEKIADSLIPLVMPVADSGKWGGEQFHF